MKKKESLLTLSKRLIKAINADLVKAYQEGVEDMDCYQALEILRDCGVDAMPKTKDILKEIEAMENNSFDQLHELWGLEKRYGLGNPNGKH